MRESKLEIAGIQPWAVRDGAVGMSVKRIRCTDDCQRRGIAKLREAMKGDMAIGLHWKLQRALECFELGHVVIKDLLS